MKQSSFIKSITESGINGVYTAEIVATLNYSKKLIKGTHASTHDEYAKSIDVHKVEVFINGVKWDSVIELTNERIVLENTKILIEKARQHLLFMATNEKEKSFKDKFDALFTKTEQNG